MTKTPANNDNIIIPIPIKVIVLLPILLIKHPPIIVAKAWKIPKINTFVSALTISPFYITVNNCYAY